MGDLCALLQVFSAMVMWTLLALLVAKTVWNIGVPYAMVREALRSPDKKHGWSVFILLDVVLLALAMIASHLAGESGPLGVWRIAIYGLGAITLSLVHLVIVLLLSGYLLGLFTRNDSRR